MTKCRGNESNRKSTAYNQTGESYFEQLSVYNAMSVHLRRLLLATSIIDAKNESYAYKKNQTHKFTRCNLKNPKRVLSSNIIDILAYDSRHHPADIVKMNLGADTTREPDNRKCCPDCCDNCSVCYSRVKGCAGRPKENVQKDRRSQSTPRRGRSASTKSRNPLLEINISGRTRKAVDVKNTLKSASPLSDQGYDEDSFQCVSSSSEVLTPGSNRLLGSSSSSENTEECDSTPQAEAVAAKSEQFAHEKDEREKYADFVYKITQEIVENGLYTDNELQEVFKKHIERNKDKLNMGKMLYEVYQLKTSLSVSDDSDVDDEFEDFIHAQQLLSVPEIRPPTPPKILNENKVIEKLMCNSKGTKERRKSSASGKSVVLVDANPELLVTERDVLLSLMEVDIDPELAQRVCKSLFRKSKYTNLTDTVKIERKHSSKSEDESSCTIINDPEEINANLPDHD